MDQKVTEELAVLYLDIQKMSVIKKLNMYKGYLVSNISYASKLWYPNKGDLYLLEKLQKKWKNLDPWKLHRLQKQASNAESE